MRTTLRALTEIWRGDRSWADSLRTGLVEISGPRTLVREVPVWLGQGALAQVPRPA